MAARTRLAALFAVASLALASAAPAQASVSSSSTPIASLPIEGIIDFAGEIHRELLSREAQVAIVFRSGRSRDDLPAGINYTHGAIWVYSNLRMADGTIQQGYVSYNLYHYADNKLESYLAHDFPIDFVAGARMHDVGIIVPTKELQQKIAEAIATGDWAQYHEPAYSLVSNPYDLRYQNCNEFMLDLVVGRHLDTFDRRSVKAYLGENFTPTEVRLSRFERMIAPLVDIRVRKDDQRGRIRTTTYASMSEFMTRMELATDAFVYEWQGLDEVAAAGE